MALKKVAEFIKKHQRFLITAHMNLEADAVGSELAFMKLLKKLGKEAVIINDSPTPAECEFLPGIKNIISPKGKKNKFDCVVFLDCSDSSRAGEVCGLAKGKPILNIDHHISNTYFASCNWVDARASCTCEMICGLFKYFNIPIDKDSALCLYSGIVVDTGSFRFNNTSSLSHEVVAVLIRKGISVAKVYNSLYETNPFEDIKLLSIILATLEHDPTGKIVWVDISRRALYKRFPSVDLSEIVLGLMRSIKGIELAIVFKEIEGRKNLIRINFRSQGKFDCNKLASKFGGGGHKNASGATICGNFEKIKKEVITAAKGIIRRYG